jgi:hypothetical protein
MAMLYRYPYIHPNRLPCMDTYPPLVHNLDFYPHVFFTSVETWNPTIMDQEYDVEDIITSEDDHTPFFGQ